MTSARILAIGGGGGGGGENSSTMMGMGYGGGGGGGAGGFVEVTNLYEAATYVVSVGAGGAGGKCDANAKQPGESGKPTTIATNGVALITAAGGGGGGGNCDGLAGGSGGGGSRHGPGSTKGVGGAAEPGQGNVGGDASVEVYGAGGGGAGGAGASAKSSGPGAGGAGRASDITGTSAFYAAGGAGGDSDMFGYSSGAKGGSGIGGDGGIAMDRAPTEGKAGTGSGGGGDGYDFGGAPGGSGIVYIRISSAMVGPFRKPDPTKEASYNGKGQNVIEPSVFYDISGDNVGTNVGTYTATATLKPGIKWPNGGGDKPATVTMTIKPCEVTFDDLHLELDGVRTNAWIFGDAKTPNPVCAWDPKWVLPVYEYRKREEGRGKSEEEGEWTVVKPTAVGLYQVRVRAENDFNYSFETKYFDFEIRKLPVVFTDLYQRDWLYGTPDYAIPPPTVKVDPPTVPPVFEYEEAKGEGEGEGWTEEKPTSVGTHRIRVGAQNTNDYDFAYAYSTFRIIGGHGDLYSDYVEIDIAGYTGEGSPLVDFPYLLTLSETDPHGFLYDRAGADGTKMSFTDASGETNLAYEVAEWVTNGVSTLYVKIPRIGPEPQTIRLYWHLRYGAKAPPYVPTEVWEKWTKEDRDRIDQPEKSITKPVCREGRYVNYWTAPAVLTSTLWDVNDPEEKWGRIESDAKLAFGDTVRVITNLVTGATYPQMPTNEFGGSFRVSYRQKDTEDYPTSDFEPLEWHIDFAITSHTPWDDLRGDAKTLTLSGRVLLANDDVVDESHAVSDQSYWQTQYVDRGDGTIMTNDVYWVHGGEEHGYLWDYANMSHMLPGTMHWLHFTDGDMKRTLWRLSDVIIGNTVRDTAALLSAQCVLPWSSTGLGISSYANYGKKGEMLEAGNLILRNKSSAVIYSPCYTNGLGTVYFDALNADKNDAGKEFLQIVVEVATSTEDGKEPTDKNAALPGAETIEQELGKIVDWKPVTMVPLYYGGSGSFTKLAPTNVFTLAEAGSRTTNHVYRFCARVNERGCCRFRIRRLRANEAPGLTADNASLILVDNIVVSYPQMSADVEPYGIFDRTRTFHETLGTEGAMMTPFPAVTDEAIYGRGKVVTYVNGSTNADPKGFVALTKLHYRWTYLGQASNDWQEVDLQPADGYVASKPLAIPAHEGDVDWWYESVVNMPYYEYFDYSGTGLGVSKDLYTEEQQAITNRNDNWFFRLRAGKSNLEDFNLLVKTAADEDWRTIGMEVTGDGTWRGFYPTPEPIPGDDGKGLYVRFEARNRQIPGSTRFGTNVTYYVLGSDLTTLDKPSSLVRVDKPDYCSRVVCDGKAGKLLFQLNEATLGATVVHADRQDFNLWNDAHKTNGVGKALFVGTSTATSGVSVAARQVDEDFGWWRPSVATNDFWQEYFNVDESQMKPGGAWEVYQPFSEAESPNGFTIGPGQWVTGAYCDYTTGMALQMEGRGKGSFEFVNAVQSPRGIESISFRPRLAQFIEFGDFTYFDGDKIALTNYTFWCRGAYDVNIRRDFRGNASLSLVAFYKAGTGCYEFRVEQYGANITHTATGDEINPGNTHRLSLYRWSYDDETGEVLADLLGSEVIDGGSTMLTTLGEKGNYSALFISAQDTPTETRVCAGVTLTAASVGSTTSSGTNWRWVTIRDAKANRLRNGAYGVLSANCPGSFRNLHYAPGAQTPTTTAQNTFNAANKNDWFPSVGTSCFDDIARGWAVQKRRAIKLDDDDKVFFGFGAAAASNEVKVLTAPAGSTAFKTQLTNVWITSFGAADPVVIPLWSLDECSVKIAPGGTAKSARNDIVIDDVVIRQWRGEDYDEGEEYFPDAGYASPSNFVYTQAWILTNEETQAVSAELNARRSRASAATSVRAPLFDGLENSDGTTRGLGLGMFSFAYTNAQPNARLLLQICTNTVDISSLEFLSKSPTDARWTTVVTYDFATMTAAERAGGSFTHYLGLHGVKGTMRLIVDPALVAEVAGSRDPSRFGSVEITAAACRDEPNLDEYSWWGWNLQTTDDPSRMYLADIGRGNLSPATGMAFALNNSVDEKTGDLYDKPELYFAHVPFLQTPTFRTETIGEVNFKARKFNLGEPDCRVTVYGAKTGLVEDDRQWTPLHYFTVTNDLYETFAYKTPPGEAYCAFRFAVTGVKDVDSQMKPPKPQPGDPDPEDDPVRRVLIDEVVVLEAIRAHVAFRSVGAFRSDLAGRGMVPNVPSRAEQPLCRESWGVQAEVFVPQLPEEVDLSTAQVKLWWFEGVTPWGFSNWKDDAKAKCAYLAPCEETNLVFRSSYQTAQDAVMPPQNGFAVVQYMLEVDYKTSKGEDAIDYLSVDDWPTPAWYNPVDYNRMYGGVEQAFSAYTILDTVAPGWAWINEVNLFGEYDDEWRNSDKMLQFVEIAAPNDSDLSGWKIRFIDGQFWMGKEGRVVTNTVAEFGTPMLPGLKAGLKGMDPKSKCVFHVVASPHAKGSLSAADGRVDGFWTIEDAQSASDQLNKEGEVAPYHPLSIQLVRPSGVIEHELTAIGTNYYSVASGMYDETCDPEKHVDYLNERERAAGGQGQFFYAGGDEGGIRPGNVWSLSLGAQQGNGRFPAALAFEPTNYWNCAQLMTPGRLNENQEIEGTYPQPLGTMIAIYATIGSEHLRQTFGDMVGTNGLAKIFFPKGEEGKDGTNITYEVDNWYELGSVTQTVNGVSRGLPAVGPVAHRYTVNVGANVSNDVTVVATAAIADELRTKYGLGPDNRYTDAVMDWLLAGRTLRDVAFHDSAAETIGLADFATLKGDVVTNLSLTEMYWLDIDPTWSDHDIQFRAGFTKPPVPTPVRGGELTNVVMSVAMKITNRVDGTVWAPYVIRSVDPGVTSWDYAKPESQWNWSSATFKLTGVLSNDGTIPSPGKNRKRWLPLRWFVFGPGSFDANYESEIELVDPYSKESPGYRAGWHDWVREHGWCPVYWSWDLDDRLVPEHVEILQPHNRY